MEPKGDHNELKAVPKPAPQAPLRRKAGSLEREPTVHRESTGTDGSYQMAAKGIFKSTTSQELCSNGST